MIEIQMAEQTIEALFQGNLETFLLNARKGLPTSSGVYIATSTKISDGIFYVGKANNFRTRCNKKHQWLEVAQEMGAECLSLAPIESGDAWRVEQVLIDRLKPKINKACIRWWLTPAQDSKPKREPSVARIFPQAKLGHVCLDRTCLDDRTLSLKAKGLHSFLMSRYDDFTVSVEDLVELCGTDNHESIQDALRDLEAAGYLRYEAGDIVLRETPAIV